jgi:hypothetical protein
MKNLEYVHCTSTITVLTLIANAILYTHHLSKLKQSLFREQKHKITLLRVCGVEKTM